MQGVARMRGLLINETEMEEHGLHTFEVDVILMSNQQYIISLIGLHSLK
jgi:hypothetical protein